MLTKPFKKMGPRHITQGFHSTHQGIDVANDLPYLFRGYGTPMVAPENVRIEKIVGNEFTPDNDSNLERGYGVWMQGLETGLVHVFWHTQPILPVWGGQIVNRGQIVAYMGNSGKVWSGGVPVPLEERNKEPHAGTHLHWEVYPKGHPAGFFGGKDRIDPASLINFNWEPTYTLMDELNAYVKVLKKMSQLIK